MNTHSKENDEYQKKAALYFKVATSKALKGTHVNDKIYAAMEAYAKPYRDMLEEILDHKWTILYSELSAKARELLN